MRLQKRLCARSAADIALKGKLYVSGWCLSNTLKSIRQYNYAEGIVLAYENGIPVGVACKEASNSPLQIFVKKAYRRQGIGKKLVKAMQDKIGVINGVYGIVGSKEFYKAIGVYVGY